MALILVAGLAGMNVKAQKTVSLKMEKHYQLWVECAGEFAGGTLTINQVLTYDKDGNLIRWHRQPMGVTLTGWRAVQVSHEHALHGECQCGDHGAGGA